MIQLSHINKNYGNVQCIKDLSMHIQEGEIYGLVGKNGAGKTTIFKIILGLSSFTSGTLSIAGSKSNEQLLKNRKEIGFFIGQNFFPYLTAADNLQYYAKLKGIKNANHEIKKVLSIVNLSKATGNFKSFSMGMKQRLGIANAILGKPKILILDEPTNGLDPEGIVDIRNLIKMLNHEYGMTILVSSHILNELEHTANRFGIISNGQILTEITPQDLQRQSDIVQISVKDVEKAKAVLAASNIPVINIASSQKTLEDYYFELVGGNKK